MDIKRKIEDTLKRNPLLSASHITVDAKGDEVVHDPSIALAKYQTVAGFAFTLPVPVILKRFLAPLLALDLQLWHLACSRSLQA